MSLASFSPFKRETDQKEQDKREVLEAMRQTRVDLRNARAAFNIACEPELVEAAVFELNALQARYAYFLRLAKELQCERKENEAFRYEPRPGERQFTGK